MQAADNVCMCVYVCIQMNLMQAADNVCMCVYVCVCVYTDEPDAGS